MTKTSSLIIGSWYENSSFSVVFFKGLDWSWNSNFWWVLAFWWSSTFYLFIAKIRSLRLIIWKLISFSENVRRGQIVLETKIFGKILHFNVLPPFSHLWQKFPVWGSRYENWSILARMFEGARLFLELEFLVSFCILMIYNHLLTCNKNFQHEAHDMKIDLFIVDFERVRLIEDPKFLVRTLVEFMILNLFFIYDENFTFKVHDMKLGLF